MAFKIPDTPEELLREGQRNWNNFSQWFPLMMVFVLILAVVFSSFYSINPGQVGVVRRFGAFNRTVGSGLHWKLPFNIEQVNKVRVDLENKEEFGFRTVKGGVRTQYSTGSYAYESLMLTGDLNVLEVQWSVHFEIKNPVAFLFNIRDQQGTLRDLSETVMRQVVGDYSVSEAINTHTQEIGKVAKDDLQKIMDEYGAGLHIKNVAMTYVYVPDQVKPSFDAVNQAEQDKEKIRNKALQAYNKVIPKAKGEAEKMIQEAEAYAIQRINRAKGEATKFVDTWNAYKTAKDVTKKRLYLETLAQVLPRTGKKIIMDDGGQGMLPLYHLGEGKLSE